MSGLMNGLMNSVIQFPERVEVGLLRLAGVVLAVVSTGSLVLLLSSLPMSQLQRVMTTATGVALQLCLYLFAGSADVRRRRMGWVLMVISVLATAAFLEAAWQQHVALQHQRQLEQVAGDFEVQQLQHQIEDRNRQIDLMLQSSDKDIAGAYRQRSDERMQRIEPLYQQREQLMQQLVQQQKTVAASGAELGSWQAMLTDVSREVRLSAFVMTAALIDYAALLALGMVNRADAVNRNTESVVMQQDTVDWPTLLQHRILSGEFGEHPSQRQLIDEVKQVYDTLKDNGCLVKDGQRFRLIRERVQCEVV